MSASPGKVAIDGPSASGKSTVARRVAAALGWTYVDSGAWYRGLTWKAWCEGVDVKDADAVLALLSRVRWEVRQADGVVTYAIDGVEPGLELRSEPVRERVSDVAAIPAVRRFMVERLRETVRFGSVVMEGRDIGTVVFPETPYKFYLDADPVERARRRARDLADLEEQVRTEDVQASLQRRDTKDRSRATAPLQVALNATIIDSTAMSIEEVVALILKAVRAGEGGAP